MTPEQQAIKIVHEVVDTLRAYGLLKEAQPALGSSIMGSTILGMAIADAAQHVEAILMTKEPE